jgi:hypothetical protein
MAGRKDAAAELQADTHAPAPAGEQAPTRAGANAPEHAPERDPDARWRAFVATCTRELHMLKPVAHIASAPPQGGAAGGSLGTVELEPLETLEDRLVELGGGPRGYIVKTERMTGGFGPQGFFAYLRHAQPRPKHVPAPPSESSSVVERLLEQNSRLVERIAQLEARQVAPPPSTIQQAGDAFGLVQNAFTMAKGLISETPKAAASADAKIYEELGRLRAKTEQESTGNILSLLASVMPQLRDPLDRMAGAIGDIAAARRAEAEARANEARLHLRALRVVERGGTVPGVATVEPESVQLQDEGDEPAIETDARDVG